MSGRAFYFVVGLAFLILALVFSTFTVKQTELAVMSFLRGEIVKSDFTPGLHFRIPFLHTVRKFEKRIVTNDHPAESFLTSEGKILNVDFFVKWRIVDVVTYVRATGGVEDNAARRLGDIVKDSLKSVITKLTIQQIVAAERAAVTGDLMADVGASMQQLGVELVDVRVRRIDLPDEVSESVYNRMRQSFAAQAAKLRAEGVAAAEKIRAQADRERTEILSAAARDAQRVRGDADSQATDIYARTYNRNPEFYAFYRSLQAYRNSMGRDSDVLVISPESDFFKYLTRPQAR